MKKEIDFYQPCLYQLGFNKPPKIVYYELRIWKNHDIITMNVYTTLKEALKAYNKMNLEEQEDEQEDENKCYVEIVKIDNLNPRYK